MQAPTLAFGENQSDWQSPSSALGAHQLCFPLNAAGTRNGFHTRSLSPVSSRVIIQRGKKREWEGVKAEPEISPVDKQTLFISFRGST